MKRLIIYLFALLAGPATFSQSPWKTLAPGLEQGTFQADVETPVGDATITVLRIDPRQWQLKLMGISETGDTEGMTARQWSGVENISSLRSSMPVCS